MHPSHPGYASVTISLKPHRRAPGDATDARWTRSPISPSATASTRSASATSRTCPAACARSPTCRRSTPPGRDRLADGECSNLITDIIACPGLDYCALANARSIRSRRNLQALRRARAQREIGELKIKISGCINACGHHHVGHIGILGVEKKGEELYQVTLGGSATSTPRSARSSAAASARTRSPMRRG
jgi:sulfite reductase (NADPH) hemoprotein beta-component